MFATTADELEQMISQNPGTAASTFLRDDSFAAWCYDHKELAWLKSAFIRDADPDDCRKWKMSAQEWKTNIEMAIIALSEKYS